MTSVSKTPIRATFSLCVLLIAIDLVASALLELGPGGTSDLRQAISGSSNLLYGLILSSTMILPVDVGVGIACGVVRHRFGGTIATLVAAALSTALLCSLWLGSFGSENAPIVSVVACACIIHVAVVAVWMRVSCSPQEKAHS